MEAREEFKFVEIKGRNFRIGKYNALSGALIMSKVLAIISPIFKKMDFSKLIDAPDLDLTKIDVVSILAELGNIDENDFEYVQKKSLQAACEMLPAGPTQVLDKNGKFGVIGLETDTATVLALTVHTVMWNFQGFFEGSPLASMLGGLLTTSQPN